MPLYVADYLADTSHLSTLEHGAYLLLLMHYWRAGALPTEDRKLANIARVSGKQWGAIRVSISAFFEPDWTHKRAQKEIDNYSRKVQARAAFGAMGGKAKSLKYNEARLAKATVLLSENSSKRGSKTLPFSSELREESNDSSSSPSLRSGDSEKPVNGHSAPADLALRKKVKADTQAVVDEFLDGYAAMAASLGLPTYRAITDARQAKIAARGRDCVSVLGFPSPSAGFAELFAKIRASPFLRGEGGRGSPVTVDWIIQEGNFLKIMEGNYAKAKPSKGNDLFASR